MACSVTEETECKWVESDSNDEETGKFQNTKAKFFYNKYIWHASFVMIAYFHLINL